MRVKLKQIMCTFDFMSGLNLGNKTEDTIKIIHPLNIIRHTHYSKVSIFLKSTESAEVKFVLTVKKSYFYLNLIKWTLQIYELTSLSLCTFPAIYYSMFCSTEL